MALQPSPTVRWRTKRHVDKRAKEIIERAEREIVERLRRPKLGQGALGAHRTAVGTTQAVLGAPRRSGGA